MFNSSRTGRGSRAILPLRDVIMGLAGMFIFIYLFMAMVADWREGKKPTVVFWARFILEGADGRKLRGGKDLR